MATASHLNPDGKVRIPIDYASNVELLQPQGCDRLPLPNCREPFSATVEHDVIPELSNLDAVWRLSRIRRHAASVLSGDGYEPSDARDERSIDRCPRCMREVNHSVGEAEMVQLRLAPRTVRSRSFATDVVGEYSLGNRLLPMNLI